MFFTNLCLHYSRLLLYSYTGSLASPHSIAQLTLLVGYMVIGVIQHTSAFKLKEGTIPTSRSGWDITVTLARSLILLTEATSSTVDLYIFQCIFVSHQGRLAYRENGLLWGCHCYVLDLFCSLCQVPTTHSLYCLHACLRDVSILSLCNHYF